MIVEIQEPFVSLLKIRCKELHRKEAEFVQRALMDALCASHAELERQWSSDREDVILGRLDIANGKGVEWVKIRKHFVPDTP